jgi:hypothetical protein
MDLVQRRIWYSRCSILKEWDAHVERMDDGRLAKIARDNHPQGMRSRGRPKKRWKESLNAAPSP